MTEFIGLIQSSIRQLMLTIWLLLATFVAGFGQTVQSMETVGIPVSDLEKAYAQLKSHHISHVSTAPQTLPAYIPAAAGISAFYFRDVDGHNLELIYFPDGKGNPKWQIADNRLFLGIDHTAIGIKQTDESLAFYRDLVGLKVAGNSENYGSEQEHLNQVFGVRLRITGLTPKRV